MLCSRHLIIVSGGYILFSTVSKFLYMMIPTLSKKNYRFKHHLPYFIIFLLHSHLIPLFETRMFWVGPKDNETVALNTSDVKVSFYNSIRSIRNNNVLI